MLLHRNTVYKAIHFPQNLPKDMTSSLSLNFGSTVPKKKLLLPSTTAKETKAEEQLPPTPTTPAKVKETVPKPTKPKPKPKTSGTKRKAEYEDEDDDEETKETKRPTKKANTVPSSSTKKKADNPETTAAVVASTPTALRDECKALMEKLEKSDTVVDPDYMIGLASRVLVSMNMNQLGLINKPIQGLAPAMYEYTRIFIGAHAKAKDDKDDITLHLVDECKKNFIENQKLSIEIAVKSGDPKKYMDVIGERVAMYKWNSLLVDFCMLYEPARAKMLEIISMLPKNKSTVADYNRMMHTTAKAAAAVATTTLASTTSQASSSSSSSSSGKSSDVDYESHS
jgi:hypothetical protein